MRPGRSLPLGAAPPELRDPPPPEHTPGDPQCIAEGLLYLCNICVAWRQLRRHEEAHEGAEDKARHVHREVRDGRIWRAIDAPPRRPA